MEIGIVGLPNVGKSTLFNALLKKQVAFVANYPFATIEPNTGVVPVPDPRLSDLAKIVGTEKIVPATVKFVDIAGLVKGASKGEGLGNKFLQHIREVDAICHVVRVFKDENIIKTGIVDPKGDFEIIETELILSDLELANKYKDSKDKNTKGLAEKIFEKLEKGISVRNIDFSEEETKAVKLMGFLTNKPIMVVLNVDEDDLKRSEEIEEYFCSSLGLNSDQVVAICAKSEAEMCDLDDEDQKKYLEFLGVSKTGFERLISKAFELLGKSTFLTAGEKEVRAWTIQKGAKAPEAAGAIHTDFEKHFIKADCISFSNFVDCGGWSKAREKGKVRSEGRDYEMRDDDVVEFKIGV